MKIRRNGVLTVMHILRNVKLMVIQALSSLSNYVDEDGCRKS